MSKVRYEISGCLEVLTPLHLGSGAFATRNAVKGADGAAPPDVALIVRDGDNAPYLPATSLKGLLRRLAEGVHDKDTVLGLFGEIKDDGSGRMGALILRGARRLPPVPDVWSAPYADDPATPTELGAGIFIAARTRIDAASGTARDGNLFFQEVVAPGTLFDFHCLIEAGGADAEAVAETRLGHLLPVLKLLTADGGQSAGKGQSSGFGRLRLKEKNLRLSRRYLDATGDFKPVDVSALWQQVKAPDAVAVAAEPLVLVCREPFAVLDASRKTAFQADEPPEKTENGKNKKAREPQLQAQRLGEDQPLLLGSGVAGALRARARWLAALNALRNKEDPEAVDPAEGTVVSSAAQVPDLTPVQRLFGVTGFAGLLTIDRLAVSAATPWDVTSVKLDRFSGAPIDNALFTTRTFVGVRLTLDLALKSRGKFPNEADRALFTQLVDDIKRQGIELGHGSNKGFGWFTVEGEEQPWRLT